MSHSETENKQTRAAPPHPADGGRHFSPVTAFFVPRAFLEGKVQPSRSHRNFYAGLTKSLESAHETEAISNPVHVHRERDSNKPQQESSPRLILSDYFYLGRSVSNRRKSVRCAQVSPLKSKKVHGTLDTLPAPQGDSAFESYGTSQGSRELGHTSCCEGTCFMSQHEAQGTDGGQGWRMQRA